jgi:hypothetical protein
MRLNAMLGHSPNETICSRLHREERVLPIRLINLVLLLILRDVDHCRKQFEKYGTDGK